MGRYVEISKQSQTLDEHYYEVTAHDHREVKPFYIGINEGTKKVFFYENRALVKRSNVGKEPIAIVDLDGNLQYQSEAAKDRVPRWLIFLCLKMAKDVFLAGQFPSNISFQS